MSITRQVRESLWDYLKSIFPTVPDDNIIYGSVAGTEPTNTYMVFDIRDRDQIGREYMPTFVHETGVETGIFETEIKADYEATFNVKFIGKDADIYSETFNDSFNHPSNQETLARSNIAFMRKAIVRRIPQKRAAQWIDSYSVDVKIAYSVVTTTTVDVIENVTIVPTVNE